MKKIINLTILTSILFISIGCVSDIENIENKRIDTSKLKNDSNSTIFIEIDKRRVKLYKKDINKKSIQVEQNSSKEIETVANDEVHHLIDGSLNANDEVCFSKHQVKEITIIGMKENIEIDSNRCISAKKIEEIGGYKIDIKKKNEDSLTIYIEKSKNLVY